MSGNEVSLSDLSKEEKDEIIILGRKIAALNAMRKRKKISEKAYLEELARITS